MRVFLVEDDPVIGDVIHAALKEAAYAADWVKDGRVALQTLESQCYDLVLLDLGLPGKDGLDVLTSIRSKDNPVSLLIITARDALDDCLRGLDGGADDYVMKPFEMAELLARMRAVLRRKGGPGLPILSNGIVSLDPAAKQASVNGGPSLQLTNREFALFQALLVRPGAILSRGELEDRIYGWGQEVESNAVEFLIYGLRRKLGSEVIKNVRGLGWMVSKKRLNESVQLKLSAALSFAIVVVALVAGMISFISAFHEAHELQEDVLHQVAHLMDRQGLSSAAPSGEMRLQSAHEDARVIVQRLGADGLSSAAKRNRGGLALPSSLTDGLHTVSVGGESFRVLVRTTAAGGEDRSRPIVRLSQRNRP